MENSDYIALASATIALLALIATIIQLQAAKRHNILSVRPLLRLNIESGDILCYKIENHGLGPGLIASVIFNINGQRLENPSHEDLASALAFIPGENFGIFEYEYHLPVLGAAYKVGDKVMLLQFKGIDNQPLWTESP